MRKKLLLLSENIQSSCTVIRKIAGVQNHTIKTVIIFDDFLGDRKYTVSKYIQSLW